MTQHLIAVRGQDCYCPRCGKAWGLTDTEPETCVPKTTGRAESKGQNSVRKSAADILAERAERVARRRPAPRRQIIDFEKGCLVGSE